MKKTLTILLAAIMMLCFASCYRNDGRNPMNSMMPADNIYQIG